jgi:hypothetical protein
VELGYSKSTRENPTTHIQWEKKLKIENDFSAEP